MIGPRFTGDQWGIAAYPPPVRWIISQIRRFLLFSDGFEGASMWGGARLKSNFFARNAALLRLKLRPKNAKINVFHTFSLSGSNPRFR